MVEKCLPFGEAEIRKIAREFPTPFYIYDERGIRENARRLIAAFTWCDRFREHFAIKATPNPDRKSTRLNSSHVVISYAVFCLKKKKTTNTHTTDTIITQANE